MDALPEVLQRLGGGAGHPRHEVAEHHAHEDERQQLRFRRGDEDVRRNGAGDDAHEVRRAAAFHLAHRLGRVWQCVAHRLRIAFAGANEVDEQQPGEDGKEAGDDVEPDGLAAHAPEGVLPGHVAHADDDGGEDERHHDHLEGVQEQAAEEIQDADQGGAKDGRLRRRGGRDQRGQHQGAGDLPMQRQRECAAQWVAFTHAESPLLATLGDCRGCGFVKRLKFRVALAVAAKLGRRYSSAPAPRSGVYQMGDE